MHIHGQMPNLNLPQYNTDLSTDRMIAAQRAAATRKKLGAFAGISNEEDANAGDIQAVTQRSQTSDSGNGESRDDEFRHFFSATV